MSLPCDPYELSAADTVDSLELFVWWQQTRPHVGRGLVRADLAIQLFDGGIRSVAAVAALHPAASALATRVAVPEWRQEIVRAARDWVPLPLEWRQQMAGTYGLLKP